MSVRTSSSLAVFKHSLSGFAYGTSPTALIPRSSNYDIS